LNLLLQFAVVWYISCSFFLEYFLTNHSQLQIVI